MRNDVIVTASPDYLALRDAIMHQDNIQFNRLIERGLDIQGMDQDGNNLLHQAAIYNAYEIARILLTYSVYFMVGNHNRDTPLHLAVQYSHIKLVQLCRDHQIGALCVSNTSGQFPIHLAVRYKRLDVLKCLLNPGHRYTVYLKNKAGNTPLHLAIAFGWLDGAQYLMDAARYEDIKNTEGCTALHYAAYFNNAALIQLLLKKGANIRCKTKEDEASALHIAAIRGNVASVSVLTEAAQKSTLNVKNKYHDTPLHIAVIRHHTAVVKMLVEKGASFNMKSKRGYTALHLAAYHGHIDILDYFLSHPAKRHIATQWEKRKPIHMAIQGGHIDAVHRILHDGGSIHALTGHAETALHLAAMERNLTMTKFLVDQGVSIHQVDRYGNMALHLAAECGAQAIVEYLENQSCAALDQPNTISHETPLHMAIHSGNAQLVLFLLQRGASLKTFTQSGYNPLHLAAIKGSEETLLLLLEWGASLYDKSLCDAQNTALHWAAYYGHVSIVNILLTQGRYNDQLTQVNADGHTALHIAVMRGHREVSNFLIARKKSNLNLHDKQGYNPFSLAFRYYTPKLLPFMVLALIYRASYLHYQPNKLNNSERNCLHQLPKKEQSRLFYCLSRFFLYWAACEDAKSTLRLDRFSLMPSQQGAIHFWMRCNINEKKSLCFIAQSKWRLNLPQGVDRQAGWVKLPLEIIQRVLYYAYQEKLGLSHSFESYRSPNKWMAAAGALMAQLSFLTPDEMSYVFQAFNQTDEAIDPQSKHIAETRAYKVMSFYGGG